MSKLPILVHALVGLSLLAGSPAVAAEAPAPVAPPVALSAAEVDALKLALIGAKPNLSTVTLASFVFPGSGQAYMNHVDRTLAMWGLYLLVFAGAKAALPDDNLLAGQRTSDVVITGTFMAMAAYSALDAFLLARTQRDEYDRLINRLTDKRAPEIKGLPSIPAY